MGWKLSAGTWGWGFLWLLLHEVASSAVGAVDFVPGAGLVFAVADGLADGCGEVRVAGCPLGRCWLVAVVGCVVLFGCGV